MMQPAPRPIHVLIADDHPLFREGLRKLLEAEDGFQVVGTAADGLEALELIRAHSPDVLLLDLAMPRMPGLEALREIAKLRTPVHSILLTASIERPEIATALQMGARGVVLKDSATQLLFKAIRCVMKGEYWVGRDSVADLVAALRHQQSVTEAPKRGFGLTPRELEVVAGVVSGLQNKEVAKKLGVSEDTVKHHISNVFDKLGVSNRLELALFAVSHGLVVR
jgi:DNA-binding NarL/FixJ family response regulator